MAGTITPERDRLQSRVLVVIVSALLALSLGALAPGAAGAARQAPDHLAWAVAISILFAALVLMLRAATPGGAAAGSLVSLLLIYGSGWITEPVWRSGLLPLTCLFVLTFAATRAGRGRKHRAGLAESRRGRTAGQVLANLSVAALCVSPFADWMLRHWFAPTGGHLPFADLWRNVAMKTAALAALAEATADTVASEVGQAYGGRPLLISAFRRVPPGTDGAISFLGTAIGVLGAVAVAAVGAWAMHLGSDGFVVASGAGVLGLFADTLFGATIERWGWIGNDLVNWLSTLLAALSAMVATRS